MQVKQNRSLAHAEETIVGTVQTAFKEFNYNCKKLRFANLVFTSRLYGKTLTTALDRKIRSFPYFKCLKQSNEIEEVRSES